MKRLFVSALLLATLPAFPPLPAHAQAAEASRTVLPLTEAQTSLQAELLARQEARLENLEAELAECRAAQPATNLPAPAQAYVPAQRYSGGFRVASEQKLTCDDYSTSYFARHPVMAKVCGISLEPAAEPAPESETMPEAIPEAPATE